MSEPKRITEAELASFERFSYTHDGEGGRVIRRLVDNERRLRGLIVNGDASVHRIDDFNDEADWDALHAEAEAIREEQA